MHWIDWGILASFMAWIIYDGLKRTKDSQELDGYFLAKRSIPWWAAGISVMATQLSAITMIGTTGQGYNDGLRFIQFYFGLPLAMVVLSITLVPFFYNSGVYTAYEYWSGASTRRRARSPACCSCCRAACRAARWWPRRRWCCRWCSASTSPPRRW